MRSVLIVASLALLVATLVLLRQSESPATGAHAAHGTPLLAGEDLAQLRSRSEHLESEVARLRVLVESTQKHAPAVPLASATGVPAANAAPSSSATQASPRESPESALVAEARYRDQLDRLLAREPSDPTWSEAAQLPRRVHEALPQGSSVEDLRCGSSMCRVLISHPSMDLYNTFTGEAFQAPDEARLWTGPGTFMVLDDTAAHRSGRVLTVMYLGRGSSLPALVL